MMNWLPLDTWIWITESSGTTSPPAGGTVPTTWPFGDGLSTSTTTVFVKPDAVRTCWADSTVWFLTSGTGLLSGPEPTTIVISLVIAEVWLAGGMVASTLSFISGVDGDCDCLNLPKPASVNFWTQSAYVRILQSTTSRCSGPVDTLRVISSPAPTDVPALGSVPMTRFGGIVESGFR